ncbi:phosphate propanoyltransferase [Vibrio salinus]|uniref:phosphate propanoyltransferase n=1 Tax=Vibrio salinus TaxID=2899784 RepID=UPI001E353876|nr:phosphate propanoyltransferase [Vibrio salinus]MCE0495493.1 phosphate propanoyltransferase [Vibrio salinus]
MNETQEQAVFITQQIMQELFSDKGRALVYSESNRLAVPIGISNRHVHLSREDMDVLFGCGASLTRFKAVKQPGQFAAEEVVTIRGSKGEIAHVRVLGPLRTQTQIEISVADSFKLGVKAPLRMSGDLEGSSGVDIIGPRGQVTKNEGTIIAWRHIHISPRDAELYGLSDGMEIDMANDGNRGGIFRHVVVRVSSDAVAEMHIDVEEANGLGVKNGDFMYRCITDDAYEQN